MNLLIFYLKSTRGSLTWARLYFAKLCGKETEQNENSRRLAKERVCPLAIEFEFEDGKLLTLLSLKTERAGEESAIRRLLLHC